MSIFTNLILEEFSLCLFCYFMDNDDKTQIKLVQQFLYLQIAVLEIPANISIPNINRITFTHWHSTEKLSLCTFYSRNHFTVLWNNLYIQLTKGFLVLYNIRTHICIYVYMCGIWSLSRNLGIFKQGDSTLKAAGALIVLLNAL